MEFIRPHTNNPMILTLLKYIDERVDFHKRSKLGNFSIKTGLFTDVTLRTKHVNHAMNAVNELAAIKRMPTGEFNYDACLDILNLFKNESGDPKEVFSKAIKKLEKTKNTYIQPYLQDFDVKGILAQAYNQADQAFHGFLSNDKAETNGIEAGLFSKARHGGISYFTQGKSTEPHDTMGGLLDEKTDDTHAFSYCVDQIREHGSHWDSVESDKEIHNHSFTNFFLRELRKISTPLFRRIIGTAYAIHFDEGIETYYRWDDRDPYTIFNEGFTLKADELNTASARKDTLSESYTFAAGISTSVKHPPQYGNYLYQIALHPYHQQLGINIVNSYKNKWQLTTYRIDLAETNFTDEISPTYIKSCIDGPRTESWWSWAGVDSSFETVANPQFDNTKIIEPKNIGNAGIATPWTTPPFFSNSQKGLLGAGIGMCAVASTFGLLMSTGLFTQTTLGCSAAFFALLSSTILPIIVVSGLGLAIGVSLFAYIQELDREADGSLVQAIPSTA